MNADEIAQQIRAIEQSCDAWERHAQEVRAENNRLKERLARAERALKAGGYEDNGAAEWRPPVNTQAWELRQIHAELDAGDVGRIFADETALGRVKRIIKERATAMEQRGRLAGQLAERITQASFSAKADPDTLIYIEKKIDSLCKSVKALQEHLMGDKRPQP